MDWVLIDLVGDTSTGDELRAAWEDTRHRLHDLGREATALADDAPTETVDQCRHDLMVAIMPLTRRV